MIQLLQLSSNSVEFIFQLWTTSITIHKTSIQTYSSSNPSIHLNF